MATTLLYDDTLAETLRTLGNVKVNGTVDFSTASAPLKQSAVDALTALAGGGQTGATPLTAAINRVTTVATTADSVALPPAVVGATITVINSGANSMQVFGTTPDTINAVATATGLALAATKVGMYVCPVAGKWFLNLTA